MSYTLKKYQEEAVEAVGSRIKQSKSVETLKAFASKPADKDLKAKANHAHGVQIKAPTGAGKTIIIGSLIKDHLKDFVTLVFSPGAGNLEEQTAKKLNVITGATQVITESTFSFSPVPGMNYVSNWEALVSMRKGSNAYITKLSKDSENNNIFDWLGELSASKTPVAIIVDESHHGSAKASGAILSFLEDIRRTLGYAPYLIEASATPVLKEGAEDGLVSIEVSDVIKAGLLRKTVRLNSGASEVIEKMTVAQRSETDLEEVIFKAAYAKLQEIDKEYIRVGSDYHGLMAIQLPSSVAGKEAIERIKNFFRPLGITVENGQIALFMNGAKEGNMEIIHTPESPVRVLLYKQGISMGWDCPRAQVLVGLRHLTSKVFTTQNLGRFIRTTEAKHYNNEVLDYAYVYSNVGDLGSKNYDKDADHTLRYEGEISLQRDENGRYALQSINDLGLEVSALVRRNQEPLNRKTLQDVLVEKANGSSLWEKINFVDTHEISETLGEGEISVVDAVAKGDDNVTMKQSQGVGVNHMVRWEALQGEVFKAITANGRDFGNNAAVVRIALPGLIRWVTETLVKQPSSQPRREHWGKKADIYETEYESLSSAAKENFDTNAFITELLLDDVNLFHVKNILEEVFSDERIKPKPEVEAEGEDETPKDTRVREVQDSAYAVPKTLRVTQTTDREVKPERIKNYAFGYEETHANGTSSIRAFRQETELSKPEESFESYTNDGSFFPQGTLSYWKQGVNQYSNFSIVISSNERESTFFPDYLAEFTFTDEGEKYYIPSVLEVKDADIKNNLDRLALEKAHALVELSKKHNIPAAVVFPHGNGFAVITEVNLEDSSYKTKDLKEYLFGSESNWKKFK